MVNKKYIGLSWPICEELWEDIIETAKNIDGLKCRDQIINCENFCLSNEDWFEFILNCYLSHEIVDSPNSNLSSLKNKLENKFLKEYFIESNKKILVLMYDVYDEKKVIDFITVYLKSVGFTNERIENNRLSNIRNNHEFDLNLIKDYIRRKFSLDNRLPSYYKGPEKGRKRILHTPATQKGCLELINFLENKFKSLK
jgi:hypothetical protein